MIVLQMVPCRLYMKIIELVNKQFPENLCINEFFELSRDSDEKRPNNLLEITSKNFKFPRKPFIAGSFDRDKITTEPGDFFFTIRNKKEELMKELLFLIRYYGSYEYYKKASNNYQRCLFDILNNLNSFDDKDLLSILENPKKRKNLLTYKNVSYKLRDNLIVQDNNFDYIGDFDDWENTIKEIKEKTGLDLTSLKNEKTEL